MSKEEILKKYGDVQLEFSNYYKYTFTFTGKADDGNNVTVLYGGLSDDIYRFSVSVGGNYTPISLGADYVEVRRADGESIASFDERW